MMDHLKQFARFNSSVPLLIIIMLARSSVSSIDGHLERVVGLFPRSRCRLHATSAPSDNENPSGHSGLPRHRDYDFNIGARSRDSVSFGVVERSLKFTVRVLLVHSFFLSFQSMSEVVRVASKRTSLFSLRR